MVRSVTSTTSSYLKLEVPNAPIVSNLNANISATGHPIHFMLCSRVGFSGSADRMTLFPIKYDSIKYRMTTGRHIGKLQRHRAVSLRQHGFLVVLVIFIIIS